MFKNLITPLILLALSIQAESNSYFLLGSKKQSLGSVSTQTKNSIVWSYIKDKWSVSGPIENLKVSDLNDKIEGYVLLNNNTISYVTPSFDEKYYEIKEGWNYLHSSINGIDVDKTFKQNQAVKFVYIYDDETEVWAGYSPDEALQKLIYNTRLLRLKKIEPNRGFYVYAKKKTRVFIQSIVMSEECSKKLHDNHYESLTNSGLNDDFTYNRAKTIGIKSRYKAHFRRGIYDESRVTLIYPKLDVKSKKIYKYGPANPKTLLEFTKEYEGLNFYIFNYKNEKCFMGVYPSRTIPPFGALKVIK